MRAMAKPNAQVSKLKKTRDSRRYWAQHYDLYILILPGILFLIIFKYLPMLGNVIAFKDYNFALGKNLLDAIFLSPWVGLDQFKRLLTDQGALTAVANTFILAFLKIIFIFPAPILLALFINEIRVTAVKRVTQTILYFPNFLSWTIVAGLFGQMLQSNGLINTLLQIPADSRISYLIDNRFFRTVLVSTDMWKSSGFAAIVYMATISSLDSTLYEAAEMDGCGRFRKMLHITLPGISSTIAMMFSINVGMQLAFGSFEQVLILYNPMVYKTGDIIQTFSYRMSFGTMNFSFSTAVGLLNNITAVIFIYFSNLFCKKAFGRSIW